MRRFTCVEYFQSLLQWRFIGIQNARVSVEIGVEDFESVKNIKGVKTLRRVCIGIISWCSEY